MGEGPPICAVRLRAARWPIRSTTEPADECYNLQAVYEKCRFIAQEERGRAWSHASQTLFGHLPQFFYRGFSATCNIVLDFLVPAKAESIPTAKREEPMTTNPFDREDATYLALRNNEGQYSLWPIALAIPVGWSVEFGPTVKSACLQFIEAQWIDMRPNSLIAKMS